MQGNDEKKIDIENEIVRLEAMLIEQDHRLFKAIENFAKSRTDFEEGDPRRRAAIFALLHTILFSPAVIATGGGLAAALSIGILAYQSHLMRQQLTSSQDQWDLQHRTELLSILYEKKKCKEQEKEKIDDVSQADGVVVVSSYEEDLCIASNARHRSESAMAFYKLELKRISASCNDVQSCRPNLQGMNLRHVELKNVDIQNMNASKSDAFRINASFSKANKINLSQSELSKSRFIYSDIQDCKIIASRAMDAIFYMAKMQNCDLSNSNFQNTCLMHANLANANFDNSNVSGAVFVGANLTNADFRGSLGLSSKQLSDVPPVLSSTAIWSPIPNQTEIGREEAFLGRTDHRLPA